MDEQHVTDSITTSAYQVLFQQIQSAVVILDNDLKISRINPAAEQLVKTTTDDICGTPLSDLLKDTFDLDTPLKNLHNLQLTRTENDVLYYYAVNVHTLPDSQGYLILLSDVTELVNLKKDYSNFAHTLSHDVKSPLGVAVGYSNMLQSEIEEGTESRFFVDEIFNTTMRIMNICNELVLLSDLEHLQHTETMPVDMRFVTENAMRRFKHVTDSRDINLTISDKVPYASGNAPWVEESIVDYLRYAIIQNPSSAHIDITITNDENNVQFAIKHDGHDAPVTKVDKMFSDTLDISSTRAEGYGLGLDVAKRLIETMDGTVAVKNNQLIFTLPIST